MTYMFRVILHYLQMCLKSLEKKCLETYELDPTHFLSAPGLSWQVCLKWTGVKVELLTDNDMLMMVEK